MFIIQWYFSGAVLRHLIIYFICKHKHLTLLHTYFTGKSDQFDHLKSAKAYQHFFFLQTKTFPVLVLISFLLNFNDILQSL